MNNNVKSALRQIFYLLIARHNREMQKKEYKRVHLAYEELCYIQDSLEYLAERADDREIRDLICENHFYTEAAKAKGYLFFTEQDVKHIIKDFAA